MGDDDEDEDDEDSVDVAIISASASAAAWAARAFESNSLGCWRFLDDAGRYVDASDEVEANAESNGRLFELIDDDKLTASFKLVDSTTALVLVAVFT